MVTIIGNGLFCHFFNHQKYQKDLDQSKTFLEYRQNGGINWGASRNNFINQGESDGYLNDGQSHRLFFKNSFSTMYVKKMMFGNQELLLPVIIERLLEKESLDWEWHIQQIKDPTVDWFVDNQFIILVRNHKLKLAYLISTKVRQKFIDFKYQKVAYQNDYNNNIKIKTTDKNKIINWIKYALLIMNTVYEFYRYTYLYQQKTFDNFPKLLQKQWNNYATLFLVDYLTVFSFNYFPEAFGNVNHQIANQEAVNSQMLHGFLNQQDSQMKLDNYNCWENNHNNYQTLWLKIKENQNPVVEINLFALNPKHDQPLFYQLKDLLKASQQTLKINYYYYHIDEIVLLKALFKKIKMPNVIFNFLESNSVWNKKQSF